MSLTIVLVSTAILVGQVSRSVTSGQTTLEANPTYQRAESPRQLLAVLGIDESKLGEFQDGAPVSDTESELLEQLLKIVGRFDLSDVERWSHDSISLAEFARDPTGHRAKIIRFDGRVRRIELISSAGDPDDTGSAHDLYRLTIDGESSVRRAIIWCHRIPAAWRRFENQSDPVDFRASCQGLFFKTFKADGGVNLVGVAERVSWYPDRTDEATGIGPDQILLAGAGMDIGLFDDVHHKRRIVTEDRECFYQLLAAVGRSDYASASGIARNEFDIVTLLDAPENESCRAYRFSGTARRAVRVVVDDADIRQRFGIDHYFEIEVFVPLPATLNLIDSETGESVSYSNYPLVFCVPRLPAGMAEGSAINQPLEAMGFYLKLWAFRKQSSESPSSDTSTAAVRQLGIQYCPLFIGFEPKTIATGIRQDSAWGLYAGAAFALGLLAIGYWLWNNHRQDRAFSRQHPRKNGKVDMSFLDRQ